MKLSGTAIAFTLLCTLIPPALQAQWTAISTPGYNPPNSGCTWRYYRSVGAHSMIYWGYMANCPSGSMGQFNESEIFESENAGAGWNSLFYLNSIDEAVQHLEFISADTGCFIRGPYNASFVYRTSDGLENFEQVPAEGDFIIADLEMLSFQEIFIADWSARIWRMEDDTLRIASELGLDLNLFDRPVLCAASSQHLFMVCSLQDANEAVTDLIVRSTDGGTTWDTSYLSASASLNDIKFVSESTGFAVADNGIILKTEDTGESWLVKDSGIQADLFSIDFRDPDTWLIGAHGTMLITWDGGETWQSKYSPNQGVNNNVHFPEKDNTVYVGLSPVWKAEIDELTGWNGTGITNERFTLAPNPARDFFILSAPGTVSYFNVKMLDACGRVIREFRSDEPRVTIECRRMQSGFYFLVLSCERQEQVIKLFIR